VAGRTPALGNDVAENGNGEKGNGQTFLDKLGAVSSISSVSAVTFILVAIKVFRASGMEASTTVAVVSGADILTLLEGVILTLLPSFIGLVTAAAIWWWSRKLPEGGDREASRKAFLDQDHLTAWVLVTVGFFTVPSVLLIPAIPMLLSAFWLFRHIRDAGWIRVLRVIVPILWVVVIVVWAIAGIAARAWPAFALLFVVTTVSGLWLLFGDHDKLPSRKRLTWYGRAIALTCFVAVVLNLYFLALSPTVWLPRRLIDTESGEAVVVGEVTMPDRFGAYVLSTDDEKVSLLLDDPRAVVEVGPGVVAPLPPICVPPRPNVLARALFLRPVQLLGLEPDPGTPYSTCPVPPEES
jgi:hypothetical protein